ncbi:hypothetical protein NPIL_575511 [Nephila pilipes]|uniref:Uncharacterized protein n=1 Tax=Nephila pilipes TaxID=299642 RepID=A0A8X6TKG5_NEPPI|nr:hypothetical protein NPIL_575511 [Nephila pilipes]
MSTIFPCAINNIRTRSKRGWSPKSQSATCEVSLTDIRFRMSAPRERDNTRWRQSAAIINKEPPLLSPYHLKAVCACYFRRFMFSRTKIEKVKISSILCKNGRTKIIF